MLGLPNARPNPSVRSRCPPDEEADLEAEPESERQEEASTPEGAARHWR